MRKASRTAKGQARQVTRGVAAAGFVGVRWLVAVCNVPSLCGLLAGASWLLAAVLVAVVLRSPPPQTLVLGRRGSRLLLLTAALNLAGLPLVATGAEPAMWRSALAGGMDLLAWGWALYGALAAARWRWGSESVPPAGSARLAPRHLVLSTLIVLVLALQVTTLFNDRPTWWPFIDYPLYSPAHFAPARAVHHRLHGLTEQEPPELFEITAQALGMSWFVYHLELIPRLFEQPWRADHELLRALEGARLPPLRAITSERTTFMLTEKEFRRYPELRQLTFGLDPVGARERTEAGPVPAGATPRGRTE